MKLNTYERNIKITAIAVSSPALYHMSEFVRNFHKKYDCAKIELNLISIAKESEIMRTDVLTKAKDTDILIVDAMGVSEKLQKTLESIFENNTGQVLVIGNVFREHNRLGKFSMKEMSKYGGRKSDDADKKTKNPAKMMHRMRRMVNILGNLIPFGMMKDAKNLFKFVDYWQQGSYESIEAAMLLILRDYLNLKEIEKPKNISIKYGIYLKNPITSEISKDIKNYIQNEKNKSRVALLFYGHNYPNDYTGVVRCFYEELVKEHTVISIAFFQNEDKDLEELERYLCGANVSAAINLMPFRLGAGPMGGDAKRAVEILEKGDILYFKPMVLSKYSKGEWDAKASLNPGEFLINILLPELDGAFHTYPVGSIESGSYDETFDIEMNVIKPMKPRISQYIRRVDNFIKLKSLPNEKKKIVIIVYNYPPGEDNLMSAAFLDVAASLEKLLEILKTGGYDVQQFGKEEIIEKFLNESILNSPRWQEETGGTRYSSSGFESKVKAVFSGNIMIGVQPLKNGDSANSQKEAYHDMSLPPSKEYENFYSYIEKEFKADAIIHLGTHGTLEFTKGKESGVSDECFPDKLPADIPHFYYYYIGNTSEAMIAKRRSNAVIVSYMSPPFKEGGLNDELSKLKEMISEYRQSLQISPERSENILSDLREKIAETGIYKITENFDESLIDEVEDELYEYEKTMVPAGLHILGESLSEDEAEMFYRKVFWKEGEELYTKIKGHLTHNQEGDMLLKALSGAYIPVGAGGDFTRSFDVLPAGRNMVQFDPNMIPSESAVKRGEEIAKKTLERHFKAKGEYPKSTAVILWGLEVSKTQGETIGQIMYYLGLRLKAKRGNFENPFEIIPKRELARPRIDTIIHICGFFRDMYPNILVNLNQILENLGKLDEDSEFAKNTNLRYNKLIDDGMDEEKAKLLAATRIFGPKKGEYATSLTDIVRKGAWKEARELGDFFVNDLSYAYAVDGICEKQSDLLLLGYETVDMISQVKNNAEYELLDVDHYYEFYGGLSKAIENVKGEKAAMYVADTAGEEIKIKNIEQSLSKGIYSRVLNPVWTEEMLKHGYHGVQHIAKRFENIVGFASSTGGIESEMFSKLERTYVSDGEMFEQMKKSNKWAYINILERLMEAANRGLWQASENELKEIRRRYIETESEAEN